MEIGLNLEFIRSSDKSFRHGIETAAELGYRFVEPCVGTGYDLLALATELTAAGADWQVHAYGNTVHAFTNPAANNPDMGTVYNARADRRSWAALGNFLGEIFSTG